MRTRLLCLLLSLPILAACDTDPARSVKILDRPPLAGSQLKKMPADWRPAECPNPKEYASGPSEVRISGPCPLDLHTAIPCHAEDDDFYVSLRNTGKNGALLAINLNVEDYQGPGTYSGTRMSLWVREGKNIYQWYRWSNDDVTMTVLPGEKSVEVKKTALQGEPSFPLCNRLPIAGADLEYKYECQQMTELSSAIENTSEIVDGTFRCARRDAAAY